MFKIVLFLYVIYAQTLNGNQKHRKHKSKELGFVQMSADLNDQRVMLDGIIQQVNQLALLVQRQNIFEDSIRQRPYELLNQLSRLNELELRPEESKIIESLKQQLNIISEAMNQEDYVQQCTNEDVCKICNATEYYQLDEDNWYMIGFEHGFKKEFQFLLDSAKQALGNGDIVLSFSQENHICLQFTNLKQQVNIDYVLQLYLKTKLEDYQNSLIHIPQSAIPLEFLIKAEYNNKAFIYTDLKFVVIDNQQHEFLGGRINKQKFQILDYNVYQEQEGQFYINTQIYPFSYRKIQGQIQSEQVKSQLNIILDEYKIQQLNF